MDSIRTTSLLLDPTLKNRSRELELGPLVKSGFSNLDDGKRELKNGALAIVRLHLTQFLFTTLEWVTVDQ